jgi:outer membrane protein OmpA-like peptidoglycan-associated protein
MVRLSLALLALTPALALAELTDAPGCKDHHFFTRMPGAFIVRCKAAPLDAHKFRVREKRKVHEEAIEGSFSLTTYGFDKASGTTPTRLQVLRNYRNAVKRLGGQVLCEELDGKTTLKVAKGGSEYWAEVGEYDRSVSVLVVERKVQEVVASAEALANDLEAGGHAAVYGIQFDTGLAVLKPESSAALTEIAKLLAVKPALQLRLVGHTDSVGALDANVKLSQARAEAAMAALTRQHGVAPARLSAHGVGPLAPVATNASEEGRARNRRVELVVQ